MYILMITNMKILEILIQIMKMKMNMNMDMNINIEKLITQNNMIQLKKSKL